MPRNTREQNRQIDNVQRHMITLKPQTVSGGFFPLAALAPFAAAIGLPIAASAGKWVGSKIFGTGVARAGAHGGPVGSGIFRAGDYKMPASMPHPNYIRGGMLSVSDGLAQAIKQASTRANGSKKKPYKKSTR